MQKKKKNGLPLFVQKQYPKFELSYRMILKLKARHLVKIQRYKRHPYDPTSIY